jgi:hypothetical protein
MALGLSADELTSCFTRKEDRLTIDEFRRCIDAKSTGAVRVSTGLVTNPADVNAFLLFAHNIIDKSQQELA